MIVLVIVAIVVFVYMQLVIMVIVMTSNDYRIVNSQSQRIVPSEVQ